MKIVRKSPISGKINTLDIDITEEQMTAWKNGTLIQDAMPHISDYEREFLISGITHDEWEATFKDDEETSKNFKKLEAAVEALTIDDLKEWLERAKTTILADDSEKELNTEEKS